MVDSKNIDLVFKYIDSLFPDAKCELFYREDYELVIAVMLSAQTSDKAVNKVSKSLFLKYDSLDSLAQAELIDIEHEIQEIGLYKNKAKNIKGIAQTLINDFHYVVPSDKTDLQKLPGIGNKSAGVIRCEIFQIPDLPVDTHIIRISKRLGIAKASDKPIDIERKLKKLIKEDCWIKSHHQLIHFGRYFCTARNPKCEQCKIRKYCKN